MKEPTRAEFDKVRLIDSLTLKDIKDLLIKEGVDTTDPKIFELARKMVEVVPKETLNGVAIATMVVILTCQMLELYESLEQ